MTSHWCDFQNTDYILHCGSNSCENHPVSSKWLNKAHERGAKWIVVDPRYTRTAELADIYCPIRSGTDIAFYGGMYNYIVENLIEPNLQQYLATGERCDVYNFEYLINYTNATYVLDPEFEFDPETGLFSGWDAENEVYSNHSWHYQTVEEVPWTEEQYGWAFAEGVPEFDKPAYTKPKRSMDLSDPMCVYQKLKEHYSRYDMDTVCRICGMDKENLELVYKTYTESAAPDKTGMILYALGQTQHTYGAQNTRAMCVMQLLLGNIGIPGGGVNALRGEPNVQGATDMGMMVNEHPAYLKWANTTDRKSLKAWLESQTYSAGYYTNKPKFIVSSLKEWFGENATLENDFGYDWWPKVPSQVGDQDWTHISTFELMDNGTIKGYFCWGMNPCHSAPNASHVRRSMANLDWLVVADQVETESAGFWHAPDMNPEDIATEVYFLPCALIYEKPGTILNSGRWLQWRYQAVDPYDESKSDLEMIDLLWTAIVDLYKAEGGANPDPIINTKWDYYVDGKISFYPVTWALNGYTVPTSTFEGNGGTGFTEGPNGTLASGKVDLLPGYANLAADGTTACAMWIYSGYFNNSEKPLDPHEQPVGRRILNDEEHGGLGLNPEWAFSWPSNRRILYNRNASDVNGQPWNENKKLNAWDAKAKQWETVDVPDFVFKKTAEDGTETQVAPDPESPNSFFMLWEQRSRLESYGMVDGPFPEHFEPFESPLQENLINGSFHNPCGFGISGASKYESAEMDASTGEKHDLADYPIVATTYSVTEHWQTGGQSRSCPALLEAMPTQFVEMSYELAEELGIKNNDDVKVSSRRAGVVVKALVTRRFKPFTVDGKVQHQVGLTHHFGFTHEFGQGDVVNDLTPNVGDPNSFTPEYKAFMVKIEKVTGGVK